MLDKGPFVETSPLTVVQRGYLPVETIPTKPNAVPGSA
jgi:hypothetical protein